MTENKKISIVIPLYNGEKYIQSTLESILSSSYQNLEILIVNDGSTDNSAQICETLQKKEPRITIFHQANAGIVSARNYGVSQASGAYLCFCDQDDIVNKDCYFKQVRQIENDQSDICMCSVGRSINGKISAYELSDDACYIDNAILEQLLYPLLFNGFSVPLKMDTKNRYPHIWSCMFRMSFWEKHHFSFRSYINFEDDLLLKIEAFSKATKISTISHMGYYWRVNLGSETYAHNYIENISDKQQNCYEDMFQSFSEKVNNPEVLELFRQVTFCKQYLDAIHNLLYISKHINTNINIQDTKKQTKKETINEYFKDNIYHRNFENCIHARKFIKKGRVKPFVILGLLSKRRTISCYYAEFILDHVLKLTLHSQMLTKLERMLKGIHL